MADGRRTRGFRDNKCGGQGVGKGFIKSKPASCLAFQQGTCTRGTVCFYSHTRESGGKAAPKGAISKDVCRLFVLGPCRFGDACFKSHGSGGSRNHNGKGNGKDTDRAPVASATSGITAVVACDSGGITVDHFFLSTDRQRASEREIQVNGHRMQLRLDLSWGSLNRA